MLSVGFFSEEDGKAEPSTTKTFFTSCIWLKAFSTDVFGSFPMRQVPCSWIAEPGGSLASRSIFTTSARSVSRISWQVSYMCRRIRRSFSPYVTSILMSGTP